MHVCLHTNISTCMQHLCLSTFIDICKHTCIYTYRHMDVCVCKQTYMYEYIHRQLHRDAYIQTYTYGYSCMHTTNIQTDTDVCLQTCMCTYSHVTHIFQPRNLYNFRVKCIHSFQSCIFPVFP